MVSEKHGDREMRQKRKMKRKLKYKNFLLPLGAGDDLLKPLGGDLGLLPLGAGDLLPISDGDLLPLGAGDLLPIGELDDLLRPAGPDPAEPPEPPYPRSKLPEFGSADRSGHSPAKL